ncbi:hypothetical protein TSUD_53890 [Trifolium subterraneum]|uniref:Uncharacterized protein n=1 Tax=Trifolium subterraneum TaxID=3900 RepID=A0A2Z6MLB4_TRISU|nr:hypothetical protein TSUD_53890 [Trifolium subterraneum]
MAIATGSMIQMPMLRTPNYKSSPKKSMTTISSGRHLIRCAVNDRYKGRHPRNTNVDNGRGGQTNSILQSTTTSTRNLQLDINYATNSFSTNNVQDDQNKSPRSIANIDYDYQI